MDRDHRAGGGDLDALGCNRTAYLDLPADKLGRDRIEDAAELDQRHVAGDPARLAPGRVETHARQRCQEPDLAVEPLASRRRRIVLDNGHFTAEEILVDEPDLFRYIVFGYTNYAGLKRVPAMTLPLLIFMNQA